MSDHYVITVSVQRVELSEVPSGVRIGGLPVKGTMSERKVTELTKVTQKGTALPALIKYVGTVLDVSLSLNNDNITDPTKESQTRDR